MMVVICTKMDPTPPASHPTAAKRREPSQLLDRPYLLFALLAAAIFAAGCSRSDAEPKSAAAPTLPSVAVAKVTTEDLSHNLVLTAEFKPFQEVDVMAKIAGYVKQINVDVGDRVRQGQLLAILEIPEMGD